MASQPINAVLGMLPKYLISMLHLSIRLLPIYILISLSLVISHAKAIEHQPRSRPTRSKERYIHVTVRPKVIDFYHGDTITIACKAKGGNKIEETPYISFYRQMDVGHAKQRSGDPGIKIEPVTATDSANEHKVKKLLHLSKNAWYTMEMGENILYCRAKDRFGHSTDVHFIVNKKSYHTQSNSQRRRRFSLHRLRRLHHTSLQPQK